MIRPIIKPAEQQDWYPRGETPYIENLKRQVAKMPQARDSSGAMTPEVVRAIRVEYMPYKVTLEMLSAKYGVGKATISKMLNGKTYRDVK